MYCNQCGGEIPGSARFCNHCGSEAGGAPASNAGGGDGFAASGTDEAGEPTVVLRPVFLPSVAILSLLPILVFMTIWGGGFFGGFGLFAVEALGLPLPKWFTFAFFGAVFFLGIPFLVISTQKKTYARTEYRFFQDRLEYFEGFFTVEEKTVPLSNVTEVHLRKGVLQGKHGLGTIILSTPATLTANNRAGIRVRDVENPDEVYRSVKELVERARRGSLRRVA